MLSGRDEIEEDIQTARRASPAENIQEKRASSTTHNRWYIPKRQWFKGDQKVNIQRLLMEVSGRKKQEEEEEEEEKKLEEPG